MNLIITLLVFWNINILQSVDTKCFKSENEICNLTQPCINSDIISMDDFQVMYNMVSRQSSESSRIQMLRYFFSGNCFSIHQLTQLLKLVSYENQRFLLAQEAFQNVSNPNDYQALLQIFTFAQYQKELSIWWENELLQRSYLRP